MTDQEITRIIAEKVMGITIFDDIEEKWPSERKYPYLWSHNNTLWLIPSDDYEPYETDEWAGVFNPLDDDSDCMEAWDKFSEVCCVVSLVFDVYTPGWIAYAEPTTPINGGTFIETTGSGRRRAMCECMVKAVTND